MQADNLRDEDVRKMQEFFEKEIKSENPKARLKFFELKNFSLKDCLFKKNCQGWTPKKR